MINKATPPLFGNFADEETDLLTVSNLNVIFNKGVSKGKNQELHAVKDVSFSLGKNQVLGVVGESGCGKSTVARSILQLQKPDSGDIKFNGSSITDIDKKEIRKEIQLIFQDPLDALNPRMTVAQIIAEPLHNLASVLNEKLSAAQIEEKLHQVIAAIGLQKAHLQRYPHEFSGGQCQRIGIARAMIVNPQLLVCDEPVSALDVSIQAQIINLLLDLKEQTKMGMIFISHDLNIVRQISDKIIVLYNGEIVESGNAETIYQNPQHEYTKKLLASIPLADPNLERERIENL